MSSVRSGRAHQGARGDQPIVRAQTHGGTLDADEHTAKIGAPLFETEDLKRAVKSFLEQGPGKAEFRGT